MIDNCGERLVDRLFAAICDKDLVNGNFVLGVALGFSWQVSLAVGMALSLSSTALVLQLLNEKNLMNTHVGETSFSVLLF